MHPGLDCLDSELSGEQSLSIVFTDHRLKGQDDFYGDCSVGPASEPFRVWTKLIGDAAVYEIVGVRGTSIIWEVGGTCFCL